MDRIVNTVIQKYRTRSVIGQLKYNTTLEENNSDNYLNHLQEELMDATLYIEKLMQNERYINETVRAVSNDAHLGELIRRKYGK